MNNLQKLMDFIPDNKTCAVVTDEINRRYFTGFKSSDGTVVCFKDKAYFIIDFRYYEKAAECVKDCEVILQDETVEQMKDLFLRHGILTAMIEADTTTVSRLRKFEKDFPNIKTDSSDKLSKAITGMRLLKSSEEIDSIIKAQRIAEEAYQYILENISSGMTEREVALMLDTRMKMLGAEDISFETIVLSGKNASLPHGVPGDDKVGNGFVLMDFGAVVNGYHSDMTRTFYMGTPSEEEKRAYKTVLEAQLMALDSIKRGMSAKDLDAVARNHIDGNGYKGAFGHSLGHGVGMEIHEAPRVSAKSDTVLEKGMVITIEPGIYLPGKFGIRIEDMVAITDDLYINLTLSGKELITL